MTALLPRPAAAPALGHRAWAIGAPRLLAGLTDTEPSYRLDLDAHLRVHGMLPGADLDRVLNFLDVAGIAGRGGAGFPLATKLRALRPGRRQVVVNGTESEPASAKDRLLLTRTPHLVLDGAIAVAAAIGTRHVTVAVHDETVAASVRAAAAERPDARHLKVSVMPGGFVAGEARAVLRTLRGGPSLPPGRRTPPTSEGVLISNVETFAQLAVLLRIGPHRFAGTGTPDEPGTTLLTIGGAVRRPGVVEVPLGTPLGIVLAAAHADEPQAVVVGGYHGSWHAPIPQLRLCRAGLAAAGGTFGAGVLLVLGRTTCALGELSRVADWLAAQSARQCGPCAFGLPALAQSVRAVAAGDRRGVPASLDRSRAVTGRGACAHPDGAARFVTSALHLLHDETDHHLAHGTCGRPVQGHLPIGSQRDD